jgi:hypothetical protein
METQFREVVSRSEKCEATELSHILNTQFSGRKVLIESFSLDNSGQLISDPEDSGEVIMTRATPTDTGVESGYFVVESLQSLLESGEPAQEYSLLFGETSVLHDITEEDTPRNVITVIDNPDQSHPSTRKVVRLSTTSPIRG